ncbi:hypothetical protein K505DRAFT_233301 [Melanomma pulvis-pyrius CBS 109.77]|uniref:Uncharacterized protein n=1 Tax=Melanomma pulvis-pyrius CBS 109.77 TaxID=1314802 RepID=A0A6A6XQG8_9PLEO|nr:hypothetical protein K505DRAFT_233301 [Melanomma pulvis-pyrius CBS 109.77]
MSSTTTTTTTAISRSGRVSVEAAQLRNWSHLTDYELHHSNTPPRPTSTSANTNDWPHNHRRIPTYRAINRELDQSQRRVYTSTGERAFLTVMFTGVQANANLNQAWNATLGKLVGDSWFRYKVGGEW